MVKMEHLDTAERWVSFGIAFCIGFLVGMSHPQANVVYPGGVMGGCVLAKIVLYYWARKLQKQQK